MDWDLGLWGLSYLLGLSLVVGGVAHLIAGRVTTKWLWIIATALFFAMGLFISEVWFGWATAEDLQPNIDGLSRDEVLIGLLPAFVAMLAARWWGLRRRGHEHVPGAPKPA
jgi:hypothetical protein